MPPTSLHSAVSLCENLSGHGRSFDTSAFRPNVLSANDTSDNVTDLNAPANITAVDTQLANYTNGSAWTGLGAYANYVKEGELSLVT